MPQQSKTAKQSQSGLSDKVKIHFKIKKGLFHKWAYEHGLIESLESDITCNVICVALKDEDTHVRKMAQFAKNFRKKDKCNC